LQFVAVHADQRFGLSHTCQINSPR
jgi:hypothetical protein